MAKKGNIPWNKGKETSRPERICKICGKPFIDKWYSNGDTCSRECKGIAHRKQKNLVCEGCGKEYKKSPSQATRFCSYECSAKASSSIRSEQSQLIKICKRCGKEFKVRRCESKRQFCSKQCSGKYQSENRTPLVQQQEAKIEESIKTGHASGVYEIRNKLNDKRYIGSSADIDERFGEHRADLRHNRHSNLVLQNAWNKHGEESFEFIVVEEVEKATDLVPREQYWIDIKKSAEEGYNIKKRADSRLGLKLSEEAKKKISEKNMGHIVTEETRKKIAMAQKGMIHSQSHLDELHRNWKGRKHTEESRLKMSLSRMGNRNRFGKKASMETVMNIRKAQAKRWENTDMEKEMIRRKKISESKRRK